MTDSTAEAIVVLVYHVVWFLAQVLLAYLLWNWCVTDVFDLPKVGLLHAAGLFAVARLVISPPSLTLTKGS